MWSTVFVCLQKLSMAMPPCHPSAAAAAAERGKAWKGKAKARKTQVAGKKHLKSCDESHCLKKKIQSLTWTQTYFVERKRNDRSAGKKHKRLNWKCSQKIGKRLFPGWGNSCLNKIPPDCHRNISNQNILVLGTHANTVLWIFPHLEQNRIFICIMHVIILQKCPNTSIKNNQKYPLGIYH